MTQEDVKPSELGAYTNNIPNSRGIKKLLSDVKSLFTKTGTLETAKQDKLTAGDNITISEQNVISAAGGTYTAGDGISIDENGKISVSNDWIECTNKVNDIVNNVNDCDFIITKDTYSESFVLFFTKPKGYKDITQLSDVASLIPIPIYERFTDTFRKKYKTEYVFEVISTNLRLEVYPMPNYCNTSSSGGGTSILSSSLIVDFAGNIIDGTNISSYIDSADEYKVLKPFLLFIQKDANKKPIFIFANGKTNGYNIADGYQCKNYSTQSLYTQITNGQGYQYNELNIDVVNSTHNTYVVDSETAIKVYRRKKLSALPAPPVTP